MAYKPPHARAHRVYQPGKRHMELMPSISRSSASDKNSTALKDFTVQGEYRAFIQEKVNDVWKRHPYGAHHSNENTKHMEEEQENILILFRKLREGVMATDRKDHFALEVYETSLHLSILFRSDKQTTSILSHILPHLYVKVLSLSECPHRALPTTLLSLLHYLVIGYPSQSRYHEHLHSLPRAFLSRDSGAYRWLKKLTVCLRTRNYARLQELTTRASFETFLASDASLDGDHTGNGGTDILTAPSNIALEAMCTLVENIRTKARATAWLVIRSAYRELHCLPPPKVPPASDVAKATPTSVWLANSLAIRSLTSHDEGMIGLHRLVEEWLAQQAEKGEVRRKEGPGMEGRWTVCKIAVKA